MFKVPWKIGNYVSDYQTKGWLDLSYFIDSNGIKQLLIKKGSKWYYPDGLDSNNNPKYSIFTAPVDYKSTYAATSTTKAYFMLDTRGNGNVNRPNGWGVCLGSTYENSISYSDFQWWDTTNNKIKHTTDSGSTWTDIPCTLPIGMAQYVKNVGVTEFVPFHLGGSFGNGFFSLPMTIQVGGGYDGNNNPVNNSFEINSIHSLKLTWSANHPNYECKLMVSDASLACFTDNSNYFVQDEAPAPTTGWWYQPKTNLMHSYDANTGTWVTVGTKRIAIADFSWVTNYKRVSEIRMFTTIDKLSKYFF